MAIPESYELLAFYSLAGETTRLPAHTGLIYGDAEQLCTNCMGRTELTQPAHTNPLR